MAIVDFCNLAPVARRAALDVWLVLRMGSQPCADVQRTADGLAPRHAGRSAYVNPRECAVARAELARRASLETM